MQTFNIFLKRGHSAQLPSFGIAPWTGRQETTFKLIDLYGL